MGSKASKQSPQGNKKHGKASETNKLKNKSASGIQPSCRSLFQACSSGNVELVEQLLKKGISVDSTDQKNKKTALHYACEGTNVSQQIVLSIVERLIQKGIDCNLQDADGNTAMHLCAKNCFRFVVRQMALAGRAHSSVFLKNNQGHRPVDMIQLGQVQDIDSKNQIRHVFLQLEYAPNMDEDDDD